MIFFSSEFAITMIQLTVLKRFVCFSQNNIEDLLGKGDFFFSIKQVIFPWQAVVNIIISNISIELMQYKFKVITVLLDLLFNQNSTKKCYKNYVGTIFFMNDNGF